MVHPGHFRFDLCRYLGRLIVLCGCLVTLTCAAIAADSSVAADRSQKVGDHLTAGEFGPAMTLALTAQTESEQASLLNQIADAQQASGETEAALGTRRRSPRGEDRVKARLGQNSLAGGAQANFGPLMALIMQNIRGDHVKWEALDGEGGTMTPFIFGVQVSPTGLLHRVTGEELSGQLLAVGTQARQADLNNEIARKSSLRMVSLTRLEQAVARRINEGLPVPESMAQLAGLTQLKYVFVYAESNEIVLAGPADGWRYDNHGQSISTTDGKPTLQLDDLVTVLRTFARGESDFGCSINTREEGAKALMEFVKNTSSNAMSSRSDTQKWVKQLQKALGRQDVVVWGVPADSRVARVIVEADYRMKLIGIDRLDAGKEIPSYFELMPVAEQKNQEKMDALRWWMTLKSDGVLHSADKTAFEIQGTSVLCQSENQLLTAEGKHVSTGKSEATNRLFAQNFTNHYAKLAEKDTVFADTLNIFDLALCSALIKNERLAEKAGWNMGVFAPNGAYATASYAVPKEIDSVVNHRVYRGKDVVVQVAGGVTTNAMATAKDPKLNRIEPQLGDAGQAAKAPQLPVGRWWWDSAN